MTILPSEIIQLLENFRPLMRGEVFETFTLLLTGLLVGEAKHGTVRSSVFAPADYQPARISDFFTTHRISPQMLMAKLTELVLRLCYGGALPGRMFWIADSTHTEKPYAEKISSLGLFHRTKRVVGRARHLKGHCYVCAAHLYPHLDARGQVRWASVLGGALLYVKGRSIPTLVGALAAQLRLPEGIRHVWIVDRGILARPLLRALEALSQFALGRLRANQVVYFAPRRQPKKGRKKTYGQKCRVDQLVKKFPERLRKQLGELHVQGKERKVEIYDAEVLLRSVHKGRACQARVIIVSVPELKKLKPWYLVTTDLELGVLEAVAAYAGRAQVEVNFDEAKELGLGHYQGRSGSGVRRWAVLVCLAQAVLKLIATGMIKVDLPRLNWSWYKREQSVGQVRRRLIEHCRPRISRTMSATPNA
ncbi:MAG: transposase [Pyrinomonadaceae bacterium]